MPGSSSNSRKKINFGRIPPLISHLSPLSYKLFPHPHQPLVQPLGVLPHQGIENREDRSADQPHIPAEAGVLHVIDVQLQADGRHLVKFALNLVKFQPHLVMFYVFSPKHPLLSHHPFHYFCSIHQYRDIVEKWHQYSSLLSERAISHLVHGCS